MRVREAGRHKCLRLVFMVIRFSFKDEPFRKWQIFVVGGVTLGYDDRERLS
jgi:hypothetical protein